MIGKILLAIARLFGKHVRADIKVTPLDTHAVIVRWVVGASKSFTIEVDKANRFFSFLPFEFQGEPGIMQARISGDRLIFTHLRPHLNNTGAAMLTLTFAAINRAIDAAGL